MDKHHNKPNSINYTPIFAIGIPVVIIAGLFTYSYMRIFSLTGELAVLNQTLASTTEALTEKDNLLSAGLVELGVKAETLSSSISSTNQNVEAVKSQVGGVSQTVGQISGTVSTLEKLSKTDPEILQKYSKVFFLNEHYVPERLVDIAKEYLYYETRPEEISVHVMPYLNNLLAAANNAGVKLYVLSAYRSFNEQSDLKSTYTIIYGAGTANQFAADQGYSEHQLGTTVDFITTGLGGEVEGFQDTAAYAWLLNNAYKYGFVLSYPQGNQYYIFEPWHWRFVGVKLAADLRSQGKSFYDMEQRVIDEYLVNIFD